MSTESDLSDSEILDKQDEKDEDFKIDDYRDEMSSDESGIEFPETNKQNSETNETASEAPHKEDDYIGPLLPGGHRFNRKLLCIKYPGNVINDEKALQTLGGITTISKTAESHNRRLELRFRPDDVFSKPACGDRHGTHAFLLRVRVKKSRLKAQEAGKNESNTNSSGKTVKPCSSKTDQSVNDLADEVEKCSVKTSDNSEARQNDNDDNTQKNKPPTFDRDKYENLAEDEDYDLPKLKVLGRVDTEFRFKNLCDFQYVPMTQTKSDPKKLECIYDMIYPANLPSYSWLKNDVPYFLPPAAFCRMDTMQPYVPKTEVDSLPENVIGKNKKRRAGFTNYIHFSTPNVPSAPPPGIETAMKVKFVQTVHLEQMRKLFEERPIWSKNAVMYKTKLPNERLKILLPSVAYYFMNGPWKITWVKLGYDPRKDSSARKYQTLDYRLKAMHGLGSSVRCKRNYPTYTLPYKSTPFAKQRILLHPSNPEHNLLLRKDEVEMDENVYIYREGMLPPSRQMFYQYCDVLVDEVQEMLAKLPDPLPGTKCHEKWGWLPSGFDVQCREILNRQVRAVLRKQMNIPEDHPTSLPRKRKPGIKLRPGGKPSTRRLALSAAAKRRKAKEKQEDPQPGPSTEDC